MKNVSSWQCSRSLYALNERQGNLKTKGQIAAGPKQHYTPVQRNSCPYRLQQHKRKLKVKLKQDIKRPEIPDLGKAQNNANNVQVPKHGVSNTDIIKYRSLLGTDDYLRVFYQFSQIFASYI